MERSLPKGDKTDRHDEKRDLAVQRGFELGYERVVVRGLTVQSITYNKMSDSL